MTLAAEFPGRNRTTSLFETRRAAARAVANGLLTLLIAAAMTAVPILAHMIHPAAGIATAVVLSGVCAWRMPQVSAIAVLFAMLFQNLFVSLVIDSVETEDEFDFIRGYNFVLLSVTWVVVWACYLAGWRHRNRAIDPFVKVSVVVFAVVGVYFVVGFAFYGITAVVYLRNIITPMLLFHICMLTFLRFPVRPGVSLTLMAWLVAFCGFFEFLDRRGWLDLTNGYGYWERSMGANYVTLAYDIKAKETGIVSSGLLDNFSINFFNSPLLADYGIEIMRLFGPNMHAISFAYALCFFSVFALYRGRFIMAAVFALLLFLTSAKGPVILFLLVAIGWVVARLFGTRFAFACHGIALAAYAAVGIVVGLQIGDYHVLGLMSGLQDVLANPIGYGVGAGGNLSSEFTSIDWSAAQAAGRTPFAVESAVGVLLYQIGFFTAVVVGAYAWISWRVLLLAEKTGNGLHLAAALSLIAVVVTGLFQEEAYFAPLALGSFMALAGMIVGAGIRTGVLEPAHRESLKIS